MVELSNQHLKCCAFLPSLTSFPSCPLSTSSFWLQVPKPQKLRQTGTWKVGRAPEAAGIQYGSQSKANSWNINLDHWLPTHSLLTDSLTHSLTHSLPYSLIHSLTRSLSRSLAHLFPHFYTVHISFSISRYASFFFVPVLQAFPRLLFVYCFILRMCYRLSILLSLCVTPPLLYLHVLCFSGLSPFPILNIVYPLLNIVYPLLNFFEHKSTAALKPNYVLSIIAPSPSLPGKATGSPCHGLTCESGKPEMEWDTQSDGRDQQEALEEASI